MPWARHAAVKCQAANGARPSAKHHRAGCASIAKRWPQPSPTAPSQQTWANTTVRSLEQTKVPRHRSQQEAKKPTPLPMQHCVAAHRKREVGAATPGSCDTPRTWHTRRRHTEGERTQLKGGIGRIQISRHTDNRKGIQCVQTRLKTSVPLVPPKPKLFLTATSIFISRAVLAQ